ncbi:MAG: ATP-binding protein [Deltaproteobacteria bacterium]|nr:ATP-binding protein [Deltaproteobacteria bacterium]
MNLKPSIPPYKSLYLPAMIIVATVLSLLLIIAVSTFRNMDREQVRTENALQREGRVIIHSLAAALKADFSPAPPDVRRLNKFLADMARDTDIYSLVIIDAAGRVVAATSRHEKKPPVRGGASLNMLLRDKGLVTRYGHDEAGERIYEIIQPLQPYLESAPLLSVPPKAESDAGRKGQAEPLVEWSKDKIVALTFRLQVFETARQADFNHIVLMAAILIILATGTLYFIFVVQKYYLVDRKLGQMKSYLENVVDSMADGLISLDNHGHIVTMNRQAAEILSVSMETPPRKLLSEVLGRETELFLRAAPGSILRDRELELERPPGGDHIPISLSAAPLKDELGQDMGQVLLIRDLREIRELKESVRRSERLASLGRLAAGIAHEIRNPLSSIRGFAQFFHKKFNGHPEEQEYAAIMVREVDRLNRVITELLDFARPRELRRESCFLEKIIDDALQLLAMELASKKVQVEKDYGEELPLVQADQEQLSQAFLNLLLNALHAVAEGGTISIGLSQHPGHINITLADNGCGIPLGDMEKIFEPFFSNKRQGTGLGLAIVNQIVENHGGEIGAANRPGGGAVFSIELPVNCAQYQSERRA